MTHESTKDPQNTLYLSVELPLKALWIPQGPLKTQLQCWNPPKCYKVFGFLQEFPHQNHHKNSSNSF